MADVGYRNRKLRKGEHLLMALSGCRAFSMAASSAGLVALFQLWPKADLVIFSKEMSSDA
jgi:hypothetical protein